MTISREVLKQDLDRLTSEQLQQVAEFIAFLKFRDKQHRRAVLAPAQLVLLATEFADEDRAFAEEGIGDYAAMLGTEEASGA